MILLYILRHILFSKFIGENMHRYVPFVCLKKIISYDNSSCRKTSYSWLSKENGKHSETDIALIYFKQHKINGFINAHTARTEQN